MLVCKFGFYVKNCAYRLGEMSGNRIPGSYTSKTGLEKFFLSLIRGLIRVYKAIIRLQ